MHDTRDGDLVSQVKLRSALVTCRTSRSASGIEIAGVNIQSFVRAMQADSRFGRA
jgi:hypothetical protein